jgi:thioredoxin reductase
METFQLGIIGFGVSGIAMTRWAQEKGINFVTLERESTLGGVWGYNSYPGLILQTTKYSYSFSDEAMPQHFPLHPTYKQILQYLRNYVATHNLEDNVRYNLEVTDITKNKAGLHVISCRDKTKGSQILRRIKCKFLAIASGFYTEPKYSPTLDFSSFRSETCHSSDFAEGKKYNGYDFNNKRVVVIGNGPSGCDLATRAVKEGAKEFSLLYRTPKWIFTRYLGTIGLNFFTNRLFLWISMKLPTPLFLACLYVVFFIPYYLFGMKHNLDLPHSIVNRNNLALNEDFILLLNQKKFNYLRSDSISLTNKEITITDSKRGPRTLDSDICISATGYNQGIPFLQDSRLPLLYKRILHPDDSTIGFIGFSPSFNWVQLSDLQARWFTKYIAGEMILPDELSRKHQLERDIKLNKNTQTEYHDLAYLAYVYSDDLFHQMGLTKPPSTWLKQWWQPAEYNHWAGI